MSRAFVWTVSAIPVLTLVVLLAVIGTGDYRNPFAP